MKYKEFVLKRLFFIPFILFGVSFITWFLSDLCGEPLTAYVDPYALEHMNDEQVEALRKQYGLDQPWFNRFITHFFNIFTGDWGLSGTEAGYGRTPVFELISRFFPATIELGLISIVIAIVIGIPLGVISAIKKDQRTDKVARGAYLVGYSIPVYYFAFLVTYFIFQVTFEIGVGLNDHSFIGTIPYHDRYNESVFAYPSRILFGLLPNTGLLLLDSLLSLNPLLFIDATFHLMLPGLVIGITQIAIISRMTRSAMLEVMKQDYILLARSKGLTERIIIYRHALKNAILPILTISSLILANLLTGTVLVESVFQWPGLGTYVYNAISHLDMASVQGFVLISTFLYIGINLTVDLLYGFIDPRIRLQ